MTSCIAPMNDRALISNKCCVKGKNSYRDTDSSNFENKEGIPEIILYRVSCTLTASITFAILKSVWKERLRSDDRETS